MIHGCYGCVHLEQPRYNTRIILGIIIIMHTGYGVSPGQGAAASPALTTCLPHKLISFFPPTPGSYEIELQTQLARICVITYKDG